ncbi:MAG: transglutaminase-like cysteine peptidase [Gammaproteobacteria bacterium]|nr:transglutaminase-like cysteine peptidase [Gammaproteobacteria bacterium]
MFLFNFNYNTSRVRLIGILLLIFVSSNLISGDSEGVLFTKAKLLEIHKKYGKEVSKRFILWKKIVEKGQGKTELQKLTIVNNFFNNQLKWVADDKLWKKKDYWATPIETLIKQAGDCEDFTIIKYFTLLALGVSVEKLKLNYVKAIKINQAHMVMTYSENKKAIPLVLDNINTSILPATERNDLKPVYSFNGEGLWIQKKASSKKTGSSSRIRLWVDLNNRMKKELI